MGWYEDWAARVDAETRPTSPTPQRLTPPPSSMGLWDNLQSRISAASDARFGEAFGPSSALRPLPEEWFSGVPGVEQVLDVSRAAGGVLGSVKAGLLDKPTEYLSGVPGAKIEDLLIGVDPFKPGAQFGAGLGLQRAAGIGSALGSQAGEAALQAERQKDPEFGFTRAVGRFVLDPTNPIAMSPKIGLALLPMLVEAGVAAPVKWIQRVSQEGFTRELASELPETVLSSVMAALAGHAQYKGFTQKPELQQAVEGAKADNQQMVPPETAELEARIARIDNMLAEHEGTLPEPGAGFRTPEIPEGTVLQPQHGAVVRTLANEALGEVNRALQAGEIPDVTYDPSQPLPTEVIVLDRNEVPDANGVPTPINGPAARVGNTIYITQRGALSVLQAADAAGMQARLHNIIAHEVPHALTQAMPAVTRGPLGEPLPEGAEPIIKAGAGRGHAPGSLYDDRGRDISHLFSQWNIEDFLNKSPRLAQLAGAVQTEGMLLPPSDLSPTSGSFNQDILRDAATIAGRPIPNVLESADAPTPPKVEVRLRDPGAVAARLGETLDRGGPPPITPPAPAAMAPPPLPRIGRTPMGAVLAGRTEVLPPRATAEQRTELKARNEQARAEDGAPPEGTQYRDPNTGTVLTVRYDDGSLSGSGWYLEWEGGIRKATGKTLAADLRDGVLEPLGAAVEEAGGRPRSLIDRLLGRAGKEKALEDEATSAGLGRVWTPESKQRIEAILEADRAAQAAERLKAQPRTEAGAVVGQRFGPTRGAATWEEQAKKYPERFKVEGVESKAAPEGEISQNIPDDLPKVRQYFQRIAHPAKGRNKNFGPQHWVDTVDQVLELARRVKAARGRLTPGGWSELFNIDAADFRLLGKNLIAEVKRLRAAGMDNAADTVLLKIKELEQSIPSRMLGTNLRMRKMEEGTASKPQTSAQLAMMHRSTRRKLTSLERRLVREHALGEHRGRAANEVLSQYNRLVQELAVLSHEKTRDWGKLKLVLDEIDKLTPQARQATANVSTTQAEAFWNAQKGIRKYLTQALEAFRGAVGTKEITPEQAAEAAKAEKAIPEARRARLEELRQQRINQKKAEAEERQAALDRQRQQAPEGEESAADILGKDVEEAGGRSRIARLNALDFKRKKGLVERSLAELAKKGKRRRSAASMRGKVVGETRKQRLAREKAEREKRQLTAATAAVRDVGRGTGVEVPAMTPQQLFTNLLANLRAIRRGERAKASAKHVTSSPEMEAIRTKLGWKWTEADVKNLTPEERREIAAAARKAFHTEEQPPASAPAATSLRTQLGAAVRQRLSRFQLPTLFRTKGAKGLKPVADTAKALEELRAQRDALVQREDLSEAAKAEQIGRINRQIAAAEEIPKAEPGRPRTQEQLARARAAARETLAAKRLQARRIAARHAEAAKAKNDKSGTPKTTPLDTDLLEASWSPTQGLLGGKLESGKIRARLQPYVYKAAEYVSRFANKLGVTDPLHSAATAIHKDINSLEKLREHIALTVEGVGLKKGSAKATFTADFFDKFEFSAPERQYLNRLWLLSQAPRRLLERAYGAKKIAQVEANFRAKMKDRAGNPLTLESAEGRWEFFKAALELESRELPSALPGPSRAGVLKKGQSTWRKTLPSALLDDVLDTLKNPPSHAFESKGKLADLGEQPALAAGEERPAPLAMRKPPKLAATPKKAPALDDIGKPRLTMPSESKIAELEAPTELTGEGKPFPRAEVKGPYGSGMETVTFTKKWRKPNGEVVGEELLLRGKFEERLAELGFDKETIEQVMADRAREPKSGKLPRYSLKTFFQEVGNNQALYDKLSAEGKKLAQDAWLETMEEGAPEMTRSISKKPGMRFPNLEDAGSQGAPFGVNPFTARQPSVRASRRIQAKSAPLLPAGIGSSTRGMPKVRNIERGLEARAAAKAAAEAAGVGLVDERITQGALQDLRYREARVLTPEEVQLARKLAASPEKGHLRRFLNAITSTERADTIYRNAQYKFLRDHLREQQGLLKEAIGSLGMWKLETKLKGEPNGTLWTKREAWRNHLHELMKSGGKKAVADFRAKWKYDAWEPPLQEVTAGELIEYYTRLKEGDTSLGTLEGYVTDETLAGARRQLLDDLRKEWEAEGEERLADAIYEGLKDEPETIKAPPRLDKAAKESVAANPQKVLDQYKLLKAERDAILDPKNPGSPEAVQKELASHRERIEALLPKVDYARELIQERQAEAAKPVRMRTPEGLLKPPPRGSRLEAYVHEEAVRAARELGLEQELGLLQEREPGADVEEAGGRKREVSSEGLAKASLALYTSGLPSHRARVASDVPTLRKIYEMTRAERETKPVTLHRVGVVDPDAMIQSWTDDIMATRKFGRDPATQVIPPERILASYKDSIWPRRRGQHQENEYVVLTEKGLERLRGEGVEEAGGRKRKMPVYSSSPTGVLDRLEATVSTPQWKKSLRWAGGHEKRSSRFWNRFFDVINIGRVPQTVADLSAVLRNTFVLTMEGAVNDTWRAAKILAGRTGGLKRSEAFRQMPDTVAGDIARSIKAFATESNYQQLKTLMESSRLHKLAQLAGVRHITDVAQAEQYIGEQMWDKLLTYTLEKPVEATIGRLGAPGRAAAKLAKAPRWVMEGSKRSYAYWHNKRMNLAFADALQVMLNNGTFEAMNKPDAGMKELAEYENSIREVADVINMAASRKGFSKNEDVNRKIGNILYSGQSTYSKAAYLGHALSGFMFMESKAARTYGRKQSLKALAGGIALTGLVYKLAELAGEDPEISFDWRSTDFMKVRIGPVASDTWGGMQQLARFVGQAATRERIELSTGKAVPQSLGDTLSRFLRSKSAPGIGLGWSYLDKRTAEGEAFDLQKDPSGFAAHVAKQLLMPISMDQLPQITRENPYLGYLSILSILGANVSAGRGAKERWLGGGWESLMDPAARERHRRMSRIEAELKREGVAGPRLSHKVTLPGKDPYGKPLTYNLTPGEVAEFEEDYMPMVTDLLDKFINSNYYKNLPASKRKRVLTEKVHQLNERYGGATRLKREYTKKFKAGQIKPSNVLGDEAEREYAGRKAEGF